MRRTNKPKTGKSGPQRTFTFKQLEDVRMLSKLSATDAQIAEFFRVDVTTVEKWMQNYEEFRKARKTGGIVADMKVAQALYQRATGYEYQEREFQSVRDKKTGQETDLQLVKTVVKHVSPDVKAAIHWLRTRQRETWSVVDEFRLKHTHSGKVEHLHRKLEDIPIHELPKDAQEMVFELANQQLLPVYHSQN